MQISKFDIILKKIKMKKLNYLLLTTLLLFFSFSINAQTADEIIENYIENLNKTHYDIQVWIEYSKVQEPCSGNPSPGLIRCKADNFVGEKNIKEVCSCLLYTSPSPRAS